MPVLEQRAGFIVGLQREAIGPLVPPLLLLLPARLLSAPVEEVRREIFLAVLTHGPGQGPDGVRQDRLLTDARLVAHQMRLPLGPGCGYVRQMIINHVYAEEH